MHIHKMLEDILIPLAGMAMIVTLALGIPLVRAYVRRLERGAPLQAALPGDIAGRLERIEHAVDAVALEVERIAEGQRFTTKLLKRSAMRQGGYGRGHAPRCSGMDSRVVQRRAGIDARTPLYCRRLRGTGRGLWGELLGQRRLHDLGLRAG